LNEEDLCKRTWDEKDLCIRPEKDLWKRFFAKKDLW
jgi:hypothetical protein